MFDQIVGEKTARTRKPFAVALSFSGQVAVLTLTVVFPLLHTEAITTGRLTQVVPLLRPWGGQQAPGQKPAAIAHATAKPGPRVFTERALLQPSRVPNQIAFYDDAPTVAPAGPGLASYGSPDGVFGAMYTDVIPPPRPATPQHVQPAAAPVPRPRVRIGGVMQAAKLLRQVTPVYPALAKQARISGVVRLEAVISRNGTIESLQVISGHPLLVPAAVEAVRQWVYRPTVLNGDPVEVLTQIEVHFKLGE